MNTILNALKSKTIWGLILAAIGQTTLGSDLISSFGITEDIGVTVVDTIITWIGLGIGVYGRAVAKAPLVK